MIATPEPSATELTRLGVTRREADVFFALAERLSNAEIAARLHVSERTVESHVASLLRKFGAENRFALGETAKAMQSESEADDAALALPAPLKTQADSGPFVGRAKERAWLQNLWQRALGGQLLVGLVAGEAGIGKSRLVAELAAEAHAAGARVLYGACREAALLPFEPFVHAVQDDMAALSDAEVQRRAGTTGTALARMIPEVATRLQLARTNDVVDAASERGEVFAGLHGYLTRAAERRPLLLVVEDVHWATSTTRDALRYIARISGRVPLLLAVTTRNALPELDENLSSFVGDMSLIPAAERIDLEGLPEPDVATLLESLGTTSSAEKVTAQTRGNPLFVRELAGRTVATPESLAGLLARRNERLEPGDDATLDMAAVLGTDFEVDILAAALSQSAREVIESLEHAEAAGLVAASSGRTSRFSFVHALFRAARYDAIPPNRRLGLHRRAMAALEPSADDERVLPELARHACIAAPLIGPQIAVKYAVQAAVAAERALALDEAAVQYRRAIDVADLPANSEDGEDGNLRLHLMIRLGEMLLGAGDPDHRAVMANAVAEARARGDANALAEIGWTRVKYIGPRNPGSPESEFADVTEEALRLLGPEPTAVRARTLAALSEDLCFTDADRAAVLAEEALAIAEALDDPETLGHVLLSLRFAGRSPGDAETRHRIADMLIAIGRQTGQRTFSLLGRCSKTWIYRAEGNLAAGDAAFKALVGMGSELTLPPTYRIAAALYQASQEAMRGELAAAERTAEQVWAVSGETFDPTNWYGPAIVMIRYHQSRLPELIPLLTAAVTQPGIGAIYEVVLAAALTQSERFGEASAILRGFADDEFRPVPRNFMWLAAMVVLADVASLSGDVSAAAELRRQLAPYSGTIADVPQTVLYPVDLMLSQVALATGDAQEAEGYAVKAVHASRERGTPIFLGRELIRLAEARRRLGASGEEIRPLVDEAMEIADRTGALLIGHDAERYRLASLSRQ